MATPPTRASTPASAACRRISARSDRPGSGACPVLPMSGRHCATVASLAGDAKCDRRHIDELHAALAVAPQTNEVGRSVALLAGLFDLVGASGVRRIRLM